MRIGNCTDKIAFYKIKFLSFDDTHHTCAKYKRNSIHLAEAWHCLMCKQKYYMKIITATNRKENPKFCTNLQRLWRE